MPKIPLVLYFSTELRREKNIFFMFLALFIVKNTQKGFRMVRYSSGLKYRH